MAYTSYKESKYDTKTGKKESVDYGIYIAGSKKNRKRIKKQLERLSKDPNLESLLDILKEFLNEQEQNNLEELIQNQNIHIPYYGTHPPRRIFSSDKDLQSYLSTTERVIEVDSLGSGNGWKILGAYDTNSDTIYVLRGLSSREKAFVLAHEQEHRYRHFTGQSQEEYSVDMAAASRIGYNPFPNRTSGYRQAA